MKTTKLPEPERLQVLAVIEKARWELEALGYNACFSTKQDELSFGANKTAGRFRIDLTADKAYSNYEDVEEEQRNRTMETTEI